MASIGHWFTTTGGAHHLNGVQYLLLAIYYVVVYAIGIFFSSAVVAAATVRLSGGDPTLGQALSMAFSRIHKILGWAVVSATVGLVLRSLEQKAGLFGRIAILLVGVAWGVVTFFVVPVLLYEDLGVFGSIQRSGALFKQRWGEQFVGNGSIGLALFLVMLLPVMAGIGIAAAGLPALGIAVGAVGLLAAISAGTVMSGIFNAALYRYAVTGSLSGPFNEGDLSGAFRPRRRRAGGFGGGGRRSGGFGGLRGPGGFTGGGF